MSFSIPDLVQSDVLFLTWFSTDGFRKATGERNILTNALGRAAMVKMVFARTPNTKNQDKNQKKNAWEVRIPIRSQNINIPLTSTGSIGWTGSLFSWSRNNPYISVGRSEYFWVGNTRYVGNSKDATFGHAPFRFLFRIGRPFRYICRQEKTSNVLLIVGLYCDFGIFGWNKSHLCWLLFIFKKMSDYSAVAPPQQNFNQSTAFAAALQRAKQVGTIHTKQ